MVGERDERVLEAALLDPEALGDHPGSRERHDHRARQLAGSSHGQLIAVRAYRLDLGQHQQQFVVKRGPLPARVRNKCRHV